jgi:predicted amidophosphoribosyltransferase
LTDAEDPLSQAGPSVTAVLLAPSCASCGRPGAVVCATCATALVPAPALAPPLWVDGCTALGDYGAAGPLITSLKNGQRRDLVGWMAAALVDRAPPPTGATVTWAPTTAARRRARGFDQAELLARALARRWGLPVRALLQRRPGPAQAGRAARGRHEHPGFEVRTGSPAAVVLVDDVATTGTTLTAAARALRGAGAQRVEAVVVARARAPRAA